MKRPGTETMRDAVIANEPPQPKIGERPAQLFNSGGDCGAPDNEPCGSFSDREHVLPQLLHSAHACGTDLRTACDSQRYSFLVMTSHLPGHAEPFFRNQMPYARSRFIKNSS